MKRIVFLGSANALKSKIILEKFLEECIINYKVIFLTDYDNGICIDLCKKFNIDTYILKDVKIKNEHDLRLIRNINGDILVSIGWGHIIPNNVIDIFEGNAINCHGSYLPDYKGSRAYMHYWANCEEFYGASIHYINEKLDDGNIICRHKLKSFNTENNIQVHYRTAEIISIMLPFALKKVEEGFKGIKIKEKSRYFNKLSFDKFIEFREYNINAIKEKKDKKLTPHKILNEE